MNDPKGLETAVNESLRMETRCASYFILVKTPGQGSWNRGGGRGGHPLSISVGLLTQILPTTLQLVPLPSRFSDLPTVLLGGNEFKVQI